MIQSNPHDVSTAFETLLEEVEAEVDFVNTVGSRSFESRDYDRAKEALARAGVLIAFRDKVSALREEWQAIAAVAEQEEDEETKAERRNLGRLRNGLRTPEAAYREPILRILQSMGGSGKAADVLEMVGQIMKPRLQSVDFDPLASGPDNPRWRNAAQWARNSMVKEGLLKSDSLRGVWEISEAGRVWLASRQA
ncbi:MAG: winged helix-turn-helix domain-containing protein [Phycisphaeraceae bacterium]|nr:winged helix-turn-helix domain-containing protein [Phycisphaeraceae bacterium]